MFLAASAAYCQQPLTLEEAVRITLSQNPNVKALLFDLAAAERGRSSANSWTNLNVTYTPGFTRFGSDEELLITQPLELNGTRAARSGIASAHLRAVEAESLTELREIVYQTKTAYLQLARAQERKTLAQDLAKIASAVDSSALRQVELGSRPGIERTQTSIELARARQQATLADAEYVFALAELNTMLGRPVETAATLSVLEFAFQAVDESELLRIALQTRGEISLAKANQQSFIQEARLARAEGLPDLTPQFRASSLSRTPRESGFGIGISIPLIDYGSRRNRILQAEESAKAQEQRLSAVQNQVQLDVKQAVARLRASDEVLKSFQSGMLDDARKLLEATKHGFELGGTTLSTYLEAQRTFRSVQLEYIDALVSHHQALAQLERSSGGVPASLLTELRTQGVKKI
jgi:cobalt-zinc-cadmium efflux system outer membrane protein